jgi:hypothetical protein
VAIASGIMCVSFIDASSLGHSSFLKLEITILTPKKQSNPKAIKWSNAVIRSANYAPIMYPMSGITA